MDNLDEVNKSDKIDRASRFGTVAILAGGKSSRMGFDKQLISFNGENIVKRNIAKLKDIFNEIIVVTNNSEFYKDDNSIITIKDIIFQRGPLSGIHAALKKSKSEYVYFLACDMPEVDIDFILFMKSRIAECDDDIEICVPDRDGKLELFNGFYSKKLIPRIEDMLGNDNRAIRNLVYGSKSCIVEITSDYKEDIFLNLNTQEQLEEYRSRGIKDGRDRKNGWNDN